MYSLTCVEGYRTPIREEIYVLDIIPLSSGPVTISSDQALSAFNPAALSRGPVKSWQTNHGNITCAEGFDLGGAVVCTAGEDGSVSMWDLRLEEQQAQVARLTGACCGTSFFCMNIFRLILFNIDNSIPILSFACSSAGFSVVAGTELQHSQASILIW